MLPDGVVTMTATDVLTVVGGTLTTTLVDETLIGIDTALVTGTAALLPDGVVRGM